MIGVLPREVARGCSGGMVPTTLSLRSWIEDVGKEIPRVEPAKVCPLGRTGP